MANPNIALSFRAPQIRSPLETYGRAQQIAANAMTMQKAAREAAATDAVKNYIAKGGKFETSADLENAARAGVPMDVAAQYAEIAGKQREATTKVRETAEARLLGRLPRIAQTGDDMAWQRWLTDWRAIDKTDADEMMRLSGGKADRNIIYSIMAGAKEYFQKNVPAAVASVQFAPGGEAFGVTVGGTTAPKAEEVIVTSRGGAPAAPSTAAAPPVMAPRQTPMAAPATTEQLDAAADAITKGAPLNDPVLRDLSDEDFKEAQRRASRMTLEQPISFEPGAVEPLTVETAPQIIQNAIQNGVIDQTHVEQLRQMVGPENDQALANWMRQNNITIQPTGAPSMRSAVYRQPAVDYFAPQVADDGMPFGGPTNPMMQQISNEVGTQFRGRDPMQSPTPGSANVPLPRVRAEAEAGRPSETEIYGKKRAEDQAASDVKFLEGVGAARESAQTALGVISSMIGDARLNKAGQIEIPRGGRAPHPGFEDVVGATWRPGARFIQGTNAADFDAYLEQVEGGAFLEAYERLKGTGQITEVEGQKATRAITRMKRSVSETEFVKAAREFEGIIRSALARADERAAKLKGTAPRRTPVKKNNGGWGAVEVVGD